MSREKVYCITDLGVPYVGYIVHDNIKLDAKLKEMYKIYGGKDSYALVYDPEYNWLSIRKKGYDLFTKEEWLARGETILACKEIYEEPVLFLPHIYNINSYKELLRLL